MFVDKMCKYEMDPAGIVEDTEWTLFCSQTEGRTDGWTRWNQYTPFNFLEAAVLTLDILKMASCAHMGCIANLLKTPFIFLRPSAKSCVFCWWDGVIASAELGYKKVNEI